MSIKNIKPNVNSKYHQGYYKLINESKYVGNTPIIFRSQLEKNFCNFCDKDDRVIYWASESIKIKYYNPLDKKYHIYYPDFYIKVKGSSDIINEYLVEVKPSNNLKRPTYPNKPTKRKMNNYKYAMKMYIINWAKMKAAKEYAASRNMKFIYWTEKSYQQWVN